MKIKVLPHTVYLPSKFRDERLLDKLNNYHKEITPVFNRTGEYLMGDKCWFEVRGRAFKKRKENFLFELRQCFMSEVDINVIHKLVAITRIDSSILTLAQCKLIADYHHFLYIRGMERRGRKNLIEMKARIKEFKDARS
jgi:hypothetical protein